MVSSGQRSSPPVMRNGKREGANMAKGKKPIGKIVLIVLVVIVIAGVAGTLGGNGGGSNDEGATATTTEQQGADQTAEPAEQEQEPYTITDETMDTSNPYAVTLTGTLTNNTDQDVSYIQVEYVLYDASGAQVGTALANTNNLKAGGTWKFEAMGTAAPEDVASWERADVTGF